MKGDFDFGHLVCWSRQSLGIAPYAEFSISEERAKELMAQISKGDKYRPFMELVAVYGNQMRRILAARMLDKIELEAAEQDFWLKIVQYAGEAG